MENKTGKHVGWYSGCGCCTPGPKPANCPCFYTETDYTETFSTANKAVRDKDPAYFDGLHGWSGRGNSQGLGDPDEYDFFNGRAYTYYSKNGTLFSGSDAHQVFQARRFFHVPLGTVEDENYHIKIECDFGFDRIGQTDLDLDPDWPWGMTGGTQRPFGGSQHPFPLGYMLRFQAAGAQSISLYLSALHRTNPVDTMPNRADAVYQLGLYDHSAVMTSRFPNIDEDNVPINSIYNSAKMTLEVTQTGPTANPMSDNDPNNTFPATISGTFDSTVISETGFDFQLPRNNFCYCNHFVDLEFGGGYTPSGYTGGMPNETVTQDEIAAVSATYPDWVTSFAWADNFVLSQ